MKAVTMALSVGILPFLIASCSNVRGLKAKVFAPSFDRKRLIHSPSKPNKIAPVSKSALRLYSAPYHVFDLT